MILYHALLFYATLSKKRNIFVTIDSCFNEKNTFSDKNFRKKYSLRRHDSRYKAFVFYYPVNTAAFPFFDIVLTEFLINVSVIYGDYYIIVVFQKLKLLYAFWIMHINDIVPTGRKLIIHKVIIQIHAVARPVIHDGI